MLADARQRFEPDSVRALVSNFADPAVGAVSGELMLSSGTTATGDGVSFYWRYEKFMRRHESRRDSTVGATGAIYAIRRALFEPIPADTILDDVLIPMRIVRRGYRVLFDADGSCGRWTVGDGATGVRPQGANHRRHVPAVLPGTMAAESLPQSPLVRDAVAQGSATRRRLSCRLPCSRAASACEMSLCTA